MSVKTFQEVPLFKRVIHHDRFDDHTEEITFEQPICITGVKVGAVPGAAKKPPPSTPYVQIFVLDTSGGLSGRYSCLVEECKFPESGTRAVRVENVTTNSLVIRGKYQTLPVALYGWSLTERQGTTITASTEVVAPGTLLALQDVAGHNPPKHTDSHKEPSADVLRVLQPLLQHWREGQHSERRSLAPPRKDAEELLTKLADSIVNNQPFTMPNQPAYYRTASESSADLADAAVDMAVSWCATLSSGVLTASTLKTGTLGVMTAVVVCSYARCAGRFLSSHGVLALTCILAMPRPPPALMRYSLKALELLLHHTGAAAAEAMLGWWKPSSRHLSSEPPKSLPAAREPSVPIKREHSELSDDRPSTTSRDVSTAAQQISEVKKEPSQEAADAHATEEQQVDEELYEELYDDKEDSVLPAVEGEEAEEADQGRGGEEEQAGRHEEGQGDGNGTAGDEDGAPENREDLDVAELYGDEVAAEYEGDEIDYGEDAMAAEYSEGGEGYTNDAEYDPDAHAHEQYDPEHGHEYEGSYQEGSYRGEDAQEEEVDYGDYMEGQEEGGEGQVEEAAADEKLDGGDGGDDEAVEGGPAEMQEEQDVDVEAMQVHEDTGDEQQNEQQTEAADTSDIQKGDSKAASSDAKTSEDDNPTWSKRVRSEPEPHGDADGNASATHESGRPKQRQRIVWAPREQSTPATTGPTTASSTPAAPSVSSLDKPLKSSDREESKKEESRRQDVKREDTKQKNTRREEPKRSEVKPEDLHRENVHGHLVLPPPPFHPPRHSRPPPNVWSRHVDALTKKYAEHNGCYTPLLQLMLQLRPDQVASMGINVLNHLRVYSLITNFQTAAGQLVRNYTDGSLSDYRQAQLLASESGSALNELAETLLTISKEAKEPRVMSEVTACLQSTGFNPLRAPDLPASMLRLLSARRVVSLLSAAVHVPGLYAASVQQGDNATSTSAMQAQLLQPLVTGTKALMGVLLSISGGLKFLVSEATATAELAAALDPKSTSQGGQDGQHEETHGKPKACAPMSQSLLAAVLALKCALAFAKSPLRSTASRRALHTLMNGMLSSSQADLYALAVVSTNDCVDRLLDVIKAAPPVLKIANEGKASEHKGALHKDLKFCDSVFAAHILLELMREPHSQVMGEWLTCCQSIKERMDTLLAMPEMQLPGAPRARRILREVLGTAEMGVTAIAKGVAGILSSLDHSLPTLLQQGGDKKAADFVELKGVSTLLSSPDSVSGVISGLQLLSAHLSAPQHAFTARFLHAPSTMQVVERALLCAVSAVAACQADTLWIQKAGDAIDEAQLGATKHHALLLMSSASSAMSSLLMQLKAAGVKVHSRRCLTALLSAHSLLSCCPESLSCMMGTTTHPSNLALQARHSVNTALSTWLTAEEWTPELTPTLFGGKKGIKGVDANEVFVSPADVFGALCLLGDLAPTEWPPARASRQANSFMPPSHRKYRTALATSFEPVTGVLSHVITTAIASQSRLMRSALVRLCARAAGLGGGMGTLVVGPIVDEVKRVVHSPTLLPDARRVLEVLVPLVYRPAIKAAFLDLKLVPILAKLLSSVVEEPHSSECTAVSNMMMEVVSVLSNPLYALNPLMPQEQKAREDCPVVHEMAVMVATVLSVLPRMGNSAHFAKHVMRMLASTPAGRASLRSGAAKWYAAEGLDDMTPSVAQAMQWVMQRLWEEAQNAVDDAMGTICTDIATMLEDIGVGQGDEEDDFSDAPASAAQRFASAVQAALSFAVSTTGSVDSEDARSEPIDPNPVIGLLDPATRTFWRNVNARGRADSPQGPSYMPWDRMEDTVEDVAASLTEGIAPRVKPRDAKMKLAEVDSSAPQQPAKKLKADPERQEGSKPSVGLLAPPGSDIPTVTAPPSRSRDQYKSRMTNLSRPTSIHVDEFQKKQEPASASTPHTSTGPLSTPRQTSTGPLSTPRQASTGPLSTAHQASTNTMPSAKSGHLSHAASRLPPHSTPMSDPGEPALSQGSSLSSQGGLHRGGTHSGGPIRPRYERTPSTSSVSAGHAAEADTRPPTSGPMGGSMPPPMTHGKGLGRSGSGRVPPERTEFEMLYGKDPSPLRPSRLETHGSGQMHHQVKPEPMRSKLGPGASAGEGPGLQSRGSLGPARQRSLSQVEARREASLPLKGAPSLQREASGGFGRPAGGDGPFSGGPGSDLPGVSPHPAEQYANSLGGGARGGGQWGAPAAAETQGGHGGQGGAGTAGDQGQLNIQQLLSNPDAVSGLLRDPVKLQKLLESNPALIALLKSKLGK